MVFVLLPILFLPLSFAESYPPEVAAEMRRAEIESARSTLGTLDSIYERMPKGAPDPGCSFEGKFGCTFSEVCQILFKNRDKQYLYSSEDGRVVPNLLAHRMAQDLNECSWGMEDRLKDGDAKTPTQSGASPEFQEYQSNFNQSLRMLNKAAIEEGASDLVLAMTSIQSERIFSSNSGFIQPVNPLGKAELIEGVKNLMNEARSEFNIDSRLSGKLIEKWASHMELASKPPPMGMPYGSPVNTNAPEAYTKFLYKNDPFLNPGLLVSPEAAGGTENHARVLELYNKRLVESQAAFKKSKEILMKFLKRKAKGVGGGEAKYIKEMQTRIKAIGFKIASSSDEVCMGGPNAFYMTGSDGKGRQGHTVYLCPSLLNYPESTIVEIIGHELGHAIDPCFMSLALEDQTVGDEGVEQPVRSYGIRFPGDVRKDKLVSSHLSFQKNPFRENIACLERSGVIDKLDDETGQQKMLFLMDRLKRQEQANGYDENSETMRRINSERKQIEEGWYAERKFCGDLGETSRYGEAFADMVGLEVLRQYVKQKDSDEDKKRLLFEAALFFPSNKCGAHQLEMKENFIKAFGGSDCSAEIVHIPDYYEDQYIKKALSMSRGEHPAPVQRLDDFYFNDPEVREALGCEEPTGKEVCSL